MVLHGRAGSGNRNVQPCTVLAPLVTSPSLRPASQIGNELEATDNLNLGNVSQVADHAGVQQRRIA
jgi:hypothetical protein